MMISSFAFRGSPPRVYRDLGMKYGHARSSWRMPMEVVKVVYMDFLEASTIY